ncbi:MAG: GIY-YIG nuclease family protein [Rhodomicrobium sp.]
MCKEDNTFGRTIQLYLVDGTPNGLIVASIHGWTGSVLVAKQSTFGNLLSRHEIKRTGVYILYGPDPENPLAMRAYIGEADSVADRIDRSAEERGFWETAVAITATDEALTKGHVRYLEARRIELAKNAGRVSLDNGQTPASGRRHLPEADRANMEAFLSNLKVILPVVGLDLLKPRAKALARGEVTDAYAAQFEIRHKSGVKATAVEQDGEFFVLPGSQALKNAGHTGAHSYAELKRELIAKNILRPLLDTNMYEFVAPYAFNSPSAAAAVILGRSSNGHYPAL